MDLSRLPTLPPVAPACANAVVSTTENASIDNTNIDAIRRLTAFTRAMLRSLVVKITCLQISCNRFGRPSSAFLLLLKAEAGEARRHARHCLKPLSLPIINSAELASAAIARPASSGESERYHGSDFTHHLVVGVTGIGCVDIRIGRSARRLQSRLQGAGDQPLSRLHRQGHHRGTAEPRMSHQLWLARPHAHAEDPGQRETRKILGGQRDEHGL